MEAHTQTAGALAANGAAAEYILYGALALIVMSLVLTQAVAIFRRVSARRRNRERILALLGEAREQDQRFEIQPQGGDNRRYLPTSLQEINGDRLFFVTEGAGKLVATGDSVEVFFRLKEHGAGTVYHKFFSVVHSVTILGHGHARIELSLPASLKLGQKRNFYRVKPTPRAVRVLALWLQAENQPLPTSTADIGQPLYSFTNPDELVNPQEPGTDGKGQHGREKAQAEHHITIPVEDISGSGIGLRLPRPENLDALTLGTHMLCLLVYNESSTETNLVRFWCLGKLVNIRQPKEDPDTVILGMEFSHWAILEAQSRDIHWFPNAPQSGVSPITQWVVKQELEQKRHS